jgi:aspartate kinase
VRRVIKFGGTSLATPQLVRNAAEHVARLVQYGEQIAVVCSAPGNATSELLQAFNEASGSSRDFAAISEFAALGEEQSVQLMCAALHSFDISAQAFLPRHADRWPIIADVDETAPISTGKVNEERGITLRTQLTVGRFRRFVLPQLRVGSVPVISGFFVQNSAGKTLAMGRGGSDVTAFIVATQISADEVVIVTDVQGVLSADPRLAENPRLLEELSLSDLEVISSAGTQVIHPRALKYRNPGLRARLIDYRELDRLDSSGTSVLGASETTLYRNPDELSMLTLVGDLSKRVGLLGALVQWMEETDLAPAAASTSRRFICYYLPSGVADKAYSSLHDKLTREFPELTNISLRGNVGELRLRSSRFIDEPGVLAEVTGVMANARINVLEVITGLTDISIFIAYEDMDKAEKLLGRVLEHFSG